MLIAFILRLDALVRSTGAGHSPSPRRPRLAADLARVNAAPRVAADPTGVDYARESSCGERFAKPLLYMTTTGDPLSPVSNSRPLETAALADPGGRR